MTDTLDPPRSVGFTVNGATVSVHADGALSLIRVLREQLGLTSVREGCGVGMCGACTVLLDDRVVSSCLLPAPLAEDREVTTLEGLMRDGQLHPIQEAFLEHGAFQCSVCTPGFVLTVLALCREHPDPSDDEIRDYLAGNLCRCGSYVEIIRATKAAAQALRQSP